jgi:hypothetical protein
MRFTFLLFVLLALASCSHGKKNPVNPSPSQRAPWLDSEKASPIASKDQAAPQNNSTPSPKRASAVPQVDSSTLTGKFMMGYQGWFAAKGDGSPIATWFHWSKVADWLDGGSVGVDLWPDLTEYGPDELYRSDLKLPNGKWANVFSSYNRKTVARHVRWAAQYGIDGFFVHRFANELKWPGILGHRNQVIRHIKEGSEAYGRTFAVMYDLSGSNPDLVVRDIVRDWNSLVDEVGILNGDRYLRHKGKPVLGIWGIGFNQVNVEVPQIRELIQWLTKDAPEAYRVTLMGGVPEQWRTLDGNSKKDRGWEKIYRSLDIISPWTVGRYSNSSKARDFMEFVAEEDFAETRRLGIDYLPVVFPGFSRTNLAGKVYPLNQIRRNGGEFWWTQAIEFKRAGAKMLYGAMFDELDNGTAMFKLAPSAAHVPTEGPLLTLDADGKKLPSDWYLRVARETGRMLRGEIKATPELPIK